MPADKYKKLWKTVLVIACMSVFWIGSIWWYQAGILRDTQKHIANTLIKECEQENNYLNNMLERAFRVLEIVAGELPEDLPEDLPQDFGLIEKALQYSLHFSQSPRIWIAHAEDPGIASEYLSQDALYSAFQGEKVVGRVYRDGVSYLSIAIPAAQDAVLGATIDAGWVYEGISANSVLPQARYMAVDADGSPLNYATKDASWWQTSGLLDESGNISYQSLRQIDEQGQGEQLTRVYYLDTQHGSYYLTACPLGINTWILLSAVPAEAMQKEYAYAHKNLISYNVVMLLIFIGIYIVLIKIWGRERTVVQEERNRLAWLEERYRIVARESDDVIFEISLKEKLIEANENFHKLLGYNVVQWNNEYLSRVHPDDEPKFIAIYEKIKAGEYRIQEELRFKRADGTYIWCRLLVAILFDAKGKPARALGKITNIDSQKREAAWLLRKAQQDALTNLYNKDTTQFLINSFLETEGVGGIHGLMVLDVDNFKNINDTHGHLYGDAVLSAVADKLRMQFRSSDIVGRIGGDEFLVFLKNVNSRSQLETQAAALQQVFDTFGSGGQHEHISCSIGAAVYPEDGASISVLFQNADMALYRAKRQGKGRYIMFRPDLDGASPSEPSDAPEDGHNAGEGKDPL